IKEQLKDLENDLEIGDKKNYLPVGSHRKSDNTIHIGRNQRLSAEIYNTIMRYKKPSTCAGHAILAVFGESILLRRTLTGNSSNRTKGISKGKTGKKGSKKGKTGKKGKDAEEEESVSEVEDDLQIGIKENENNEKKNKEIHIISFYKTIHIGRNQRLSAEIYNTIIRSKKPSACAGHAILAVFGESILLRSTLTGNSSNRTKGISKGKTGKKGSKKGKTAKKGKDADEEESVSEVEDDLQIGIKENENNENKNKEIPQFQLVKICLHTMCEQK
ncbi:hypothetical protein TSAR_005615, partial [Trichomalopsis sarcophagae]